MLHNLQISCGHLSEQLMPMLSVEGRSEIMIDIEKFSEKCHVSFSFFFFF